MSRRGPRAQQDSRGGRKAAMNAGVRLHRRSAGRATLRARGAASKKLTWSSSARRMMASAAVASIENPAVKVIDPSTATPGRGRLGIRLEMEPGQRPLSPPRTG